MHLDQFVLSNILLYGLLSCKFHVVQTLRPGPNFFQEMFTDFWKFDLSRSKTCCYNYCTFTKCRVLWSKWHHNVQQYALNSFKSRALAYVFFLVIPVEVPWKVGYHNFKDILKDWKRWQNSQRQCLW